MAPDDTNLSAPSPDLLRFLETTQGVVGDAFLPANFRDLLAELVTLDHLKAVERNPDDRLWWLQISLQVANLARGPGGFV